MLLVAPELYIWVSLSIFCTLACITECGTCPSDGLRNAVDYNACGSNKNSCNGLQNSYPSYFSSEHGSRCQKKVLIGENVCSGSELFFFYSTVCGSHTKEQCSRTGNSDVNRSKLGAGLAQKSSRHDSNLSLSSDDLMFHLPDWTTLACFLNFGEVGIGNSPPSVNSTDLNVLSSCREHLIYKREPGFSLRSIKTEKSPSTDSSSPCVSISPKILDWGQNYVYHPSTAFLKLKNICNTSVVKVHKPFSTDSQFYPFNFSEVVLKPGNFTSISFGFLPKWLGSSTAEVILQTSLGGFLVQAKGIAVESPLKLRPLVGFDASSGEWLSRKLFLTNPFNETIHLKEVTALFSVIGNSGSLLVEAVRKKQNSQEFNEHTFSDSNKDSNGNRDQLYPVVMTITALTNWSITSQRSGGVLEMAFSSDSLEGKVSGALCMQLVRPLKGEKYTIVVPFEAEIKGRETRVDTDTPLSVSLEAVGSCDKSGTIISLSVRNNALNLLKVVGVSIVGESKELMKIKYIEGLLFPGSVTQVALLTYEPSNVMFDVSVSCRLQILVNDSTFPTLEVPCLELFGTSPRSCTANLSNRARSSTNYVKAESSKALGDAELEEFVLQKWRGHRTMSVFYVLDNHELVYPLVPVDRYFAKSITVKNPSQQPVTVQLILTSGETVFNCKSHNGHLLPPSPSSLLPSASISPTRYGFSVLESSVTEVTLNPYGMASLGPIFFHPSNRCEWKSSALIRNSLSGVEQLSLLGFGGSLSLVLLEGSELLHKLQFNLTLPSVNTSNPINIPYVEDASTGCRKPLFKKLSARNTGDFPVIINRIDVSGVGCKLDGFSVRPCKRFTLEPGQAVELEVSYQADFTRPVVQRELELKLAAGILVIPMQVSIPTNALNFCRKSILWARVKRCCVAMVLSAVGMLLLFFIVIPLVMPSDFIHCLIKSNTRSVSLAKTKDRSSTLRRSQGNGKSFKSAKTGQSRSVQRDEAARVLSCSTSQQRDLRQGIAKEHQTQMSSSPRAVKENGFPSLTSESTEVENFDKLDAAPSVCLTVKTRNDKRRRSRKRNGASSGLMALIEVSSSQSGNSTPSSPRSPMTTPSPKEAYIPSLEKSKPLGSLSPFSRSRGEKTKANTSSPETTTTTKVAGNDRAKLFPVQPRPFCQTESGSKPMLLPSATFPGTGRTSQGLSNAAPSRLAISPHARAPGPVTLPQKTVQTEGLTRLEDMYTYNIWGDHFSRLHLMGKTDGSFGLTSETIESDSNSFFVKGPQQIFMTNYQPQSESKVVNQRTRLSGLEKAITTSVRQRCKQQKLALLQDVDRLKKKLRYEENIHRALQRAFNRPLGARPRLPPYLPPKMVALVAEIAVLEEEVVRLEELLVDYWQNLYQESVLICSEWILEKPKEEHSKLQKSSSSKARSAPPSLDISSDQSSIKLGQIESTSPVIASDQTAKSSCDLVDSIRTRKEQHSYQESLFISSNRKLENPTEFCAQRLSKTSRQEQPKLQKSSSLDQARTASPSLDILSDQSSLQLAMTASTSSTISSDQTGESSCDFVNTRQTRKEQNSPRKGKGKGNQTHCNPKHKTDFSQHKRSCSGIFFTRISGSY